MSSGEGLGHDDPQRRRESADTAKPADDLDAALALIASEGPRAGIERRMLAQLRHVPVSRHPSFAARYASAAAALFAVVALAATLQVVVARRQTVFVPMRLAAPASGHGMSAAAAVQSASEPIHPLSAGRGGKHPGRGRHGRVLLPGGVVVPRQRALRVQP
jgi:hypothetical protein